MVLSHLDVIFVFLSFVTIKVSLKIDVEGCSDKKTSLFYTSWLNPERIIG